jgi:2-dehydro-3-deoxygluconokinase
MGADMSGDQSRVDLVTLGEAMALFVTSDESPLARARGFQLSVAGAESNVAIGVARLGGTARWLGRVGADGLGNSVLRMMRSEGVLLDGATVDTNIATGVLIRDRHPRRPIEVVYCQTGAAGSRLAPEDILDRYLHDARILHVTGITAALSESARDATLHACDIAREAGVPVSFDPNLRIKLWSPDEARSTMVELARRSRIVLTGLKESRAITGAKEPAAIAEWYFDHGAEEVVIKDGIAGCWATDGGPLVRQEPFPATPLDPIGAGDAFAAAYLLYWLNGRSLADRLRAGAAAGAISVESVGDIEGLPTMAALQARLSDDSEVQR